MLAQLLPLVAEVLDAKKHDIEAAPAQRGKNEEHEPDDHDPLGRLVREIHRACLANDAHQVTHDKGKHPPDPEPGAA